MDIRSQRSLLLWTLAIISLAVVYLAREKAETGKANAVLVNLFCEIAQKHTSTADLRHLLASTKYAQLQLDDRAPRWIVETPTRFGARNWVLYLDVNGMEIRALRIRTLDSDKMHPEEAPADIAAL